MDGDYRIGDGGGCVRRGGADGCERADEWADECADEWADECAGEWAGNGARGGGDRG
jgi:hypothetical protein